MASSAEAIGNNGGNAGVLTLNLNNAPSNTNTNIGFRVSRDSKQWPDIRLVLTWSVPLVSDRFNQSFVESMDTANDE